MAEVELSHPVRLEAPAKLNLGLEVLGHRPDGYHDLVTILQAVSLVDLITLTPARELRYDPITGARPESDLVARALSLARDEFGIELRAEVVLEKRIPIAAGLGGGSSDAGTLLGALGAAAGVPLDEIEVAASRLGADVPFFVRGGTALATGTGIHLEPLSAPSNVWFVVAVPGVHIARKTQRLFAGLEREDYSNGDAVRAQADRLRSRLPLDTSLLRSAFGRSLMEWSEVRAAIDALLAAGAGVVLPSGAGPSVFAVFDREEDAQHAAAAVARVMARVFACAPLGPVR